MAIASTMTPARDIACAKLFVDAARVRKTADMVIMLMNVNKKKIKNWEGSYRFYSQVSMFGIL